MIIKRAKSISFFVAGTPAPGGSKRAFVLRRKGGAIVTRPNGSPIVNVTDAAGEKNKIWRSSVALFGSVAMGGRSPMLEPLAVQVTFYVKRPAGHFGTGRNAGVLKESAPAFPAGTPDLLKLMRSTEDALTGIVWKDDAQIVDEVLHKRYGEKTGAQIVVSVPD